MEDVKRKKRKKRRRRSGAGRALFVLAALAAGVVLCVVMFFKVETIAVQSTGVYTEEEIVAACGIRQGQNIFAVRTGEAEKKLLEQFPYLSSVQVKRRLPSTVEITFRGENAVYAAVSSSGKYTVLTSGCKVLEQASGALPDNLLAVYGADFSACPAGKSAAEAENAKKDEEKDEALLDEAYALEELNAALSDSGLTGVTYLDVADVLDIKLLYQKRVLISLGSVLDAGEKLRAAKKVLEDELAADYTGTLNVRVKDRVYAKSCDISELVNAVYLTQSIINY